MYILPNTQMVRAKISNAFSEGEINEALRSQKKDNKSVGMDQIPSGIFKIFRIKQIGILKRIQRNTRWRYDKLMEDWVIVYIYKSKTETILRNFRPITLLNSIYKIWATIVANRITPIMNMLTDERQHDYKSNKSTIDVIYNIKRNLIKNNVLGNIT